MSRKYKVDEILADLSDAERREYDALARGPATTIDDLLQWLFERGCKISRGAVWKHRRNYQEVLDGVKRSAEMARAFSQVARESGVAGMNDAIMARFQQLQMEWSFAQLEGGNLTPEDLERFAKSMNHAASAAQRNDDLRTRFDEAMKALSAKTSGENQTHGTITERDIAEVRKAIFG